MRQLAALVIVCLFVAALTSWPVAGLVAATLLSVHLLVSWVAR